MGVNPPEQGPGQGDGRWHPPHYPGQAGGQPPPPRPPGGLSVGLQILIGAVAGPIALASLGTLPMLLVSALAQAAGAGSGAVEAAGVVGTLLGLAAVVAGLVYRPTRFYVLGAIIGCAVALIVLAGVCIAILVGLSNVG